MRRINIFSNNCTKEANAHVCYGPLFDHHPPPENAVSPAEKTTDNAVFCKKPPTALAGLDSPPPPPYIKIYILY